MDSQPAQPSTTRATNLSSCPEATAAADNEHSADSEEGDTSSSTSSSSSASTELVGAADAPTAEGPRPEKPTSLATSAAAEGALHHAQPVATDLAHLVPVSSPSSFAAESAGSSKKQEGPAADKGSHHTHKLVPVSAGDRCLQLPHHQTLGFTFHQGPSLHLPAPSLPRAISSAGSLPSPLLVSPCPSLDFSYSNMEGAIALPDLSQLVAPGSPTATSATNLTGGLVTGGSGSMLPEPPLVLLLSPTAPEPAAAHAVMGAHGEGTSGHGVEGMHGGDMAPMRICAPGAAWGVDMEPLPAHLTMPPAVMAATAMPPGAMPPATAMQQAYMGEGQFLENAAGTAMACSSTPLSAFLAPGSDFSALVVPVSATASASAAAPFILTAAPAPTSAGTKGPVPVAQVAPSQAQQPHPPLAHSALPPPHVLSAASQLPPYNPPLSQPAPAQQPDVTAGEASHAGILSSISLGGSSTGAEAVAAGGGESAGDEGSLGSQVEWQEREEEEEEDSESLALDLMGGLLGEVGEGEGVVSEEVEDEEEAERVAALARERLQRMARDASLVLPPLVRGLTAVMYEL